MNRDGPETADLLEKIVTGGQTGVDQTAWRVARGFRIATGGWMPQGFLTEDGPRPDLAELFGAAEMPSPAYRARTEQNARDSDATLWFGAIDTPGAYATIESCHKLSRSCLRVEPGGPTRPSQVADWLRQGRVKTLNVAGSRESEDPEIGTRVERFLSAVLRMLGHEPQCPAPPDDTET